MRYVLLATLFCCYYLSSQKSVEFGNLTEAERNFGIFEKDSATVAVYLYESGDNYFEIRGDYIWLITKYHARIKILKKQGYDQANVGIPYYHNDERSEKVLRIRGVTHNNGATIGVDKDEIFTVDINERWSEKRFTFPNVQVGSILEYTYEVQSPFHFNLTGWDFQSDIPKIYTEYNARIPGNWVYNRALIGELKLDVNDASIKKSCFHVPGVSKDADCEVLRYAMKDVPAFDDSEQFMLAAGNYRSRLDFELSEYHTFDGMKQKYTRSWKDVDKEFKTNKDVGRQLRKKNFFEKNVPLNLLVEGNLLERAKNIYAFVQGRFAWNGKYGLWRNNRVKKAFEEKKGNIAEINITLLNLLNAAGIEANMMLMATRDRGLPKMTHPVMSDFNYIVAKVDIDGKTYLLDATDKSVPFGMLPFRCLNYYGRVMDFDKESYWFDIEPAKGNKKMVRSSLSLDIEKQNANGSMVVTSMGYPSVDQRREINSMTKEEYLERLEADFGDDFYLTSYEIKKKFSDERKLTEHFEFEIENVFQGEDIYINPFLIKFFSKNPFTASERHYPIDFGYLRNYGYSMVLKVPDGYKLKSLPETKAIGLPQNSGMLRFQCREELTGVINIFFDLKLNETQYRSDAYDIIKEFFGEAVKAQTQSYIVLEKV